MNTKQFLSSSLIVVASPWPPEARADGGFALTTRADVKAQVLQARAAGELRPAGEASEPMAYRFGPSTRSRADVRAEVVMARLQGDLVPAGQGAESHDASGPSMLARADVKADTLQARLHGELTPSGEGFGPVDRQQRLVRYPGERMAAAPRR